MDTGIDKVLRHEMRHRTKAISRFLPSFRHCGATSRGAAGLARAHGFGVQAPIYVARTRGTLWSCIRAFHHCVFNSVMHFIVVQVHVTLHIFKCFVSRGKVSDQGQKAGVVTFELHAVLHIFTCCVSRGKVSDQGQKMAELHTVAGTHAHTHTHK